MASYSSGTTGGKSSTGRRLSLEERLQAFRNMATDTSSNYRTAMTYGKLGYSMDDDEDTQVKKRIKALRNGYTNYFEQQEERKRQEEQRQRELEQRRQDSQERMEAYRKRNQEQREALKAALESEANQTPTATRRTTAATATPQTSRTATAPNRAARPVGQETAALQPRQERAQSSSTGGGDLAWLQDQRRQRDAQLQANKSGARSVDFTGSTYQTAKPQTTDYTSQISQIDTYLSYLKREEDLLKEVKKGNLMKTQELQAFQQEATPIIGNLANLSNSNDVRAQMDTLARQKQELQALSSAQTIRNDSATRELYEKTGTAVQDLQDLQYMLADAANGSRTDSERYSSIKEKYGITDRELADYARAAGTGASEDEYQYLTGLSGEYRNLLNLRDHLQNEITSGQERLQQAGVDYQGIEDYIDRARRDEAVTQQAEANREYMQQGPGQYLLGSALSVGGNILSSTEALDLFLRNRGNNDPTLDNYRPYSAGDMPITSWTQALREGGGEASGETFANLFSRNGKQNETARWWGNFLYGTGMSIADSATVMAASAATFGAAGLGTAAAEAATLAIMGGTASSNTALDAIQKGASNDQITKVSLAAGVFEAAFEKFSVERLMDSRYVASLGGIVRETLKQMGTEASEEMATEIANICADAVIMTDKSDFQQARQQYRYNYMTDHGYSYEEADKLAKSSAVYDMMKRVLASGLGGAISGFAMGVGHNVGASQMDYASDILENARNGAMPTEEEQELIRQTMVDGESLLKDARAAVEEYRKQNADRIASTNQKAQEAAGVRQAAGEADTQGNAQNANQGQQGQKKRQKISIKEWAAQRKATRQNNRIGARDMRTDPEASSARGNALNTATFHYLDQVSKASGVNINIVDSIPGNSDIDGFYYDGEMYITEDSLRTGNALRTTATHEVTHSLKDSAHEAYEALKKAVTDEAGGEDNLVNPVLEAAKQNGVEMDRETALDEAIAIRLEQISSSPYLLEKIAYQNGNLAQRLYMNLRNFAARVATRGQTQEAKELQAVVDRWGDALYQANTGRQRQTRTGRDSTVGDTSRGNASQGATLQGDNGLQAGPTEETTAADQQGQTEDQAAQQQNTQEDQAPTLQGDGITAGPVQEQTADQTAAEETETQGENQAEDQAETENQGQEEQQEETRQTEEQEQGQETKEQTEEQRRETARRAAADREVYGMFAQAAADQAQQERLSQRQYRGESVLQGENGLVAGERQTARELQQQRELQKYEQNDPDLQLIRRNIQRGLIDPQDYNALRNRILAADDQYQRLLRQQEDQRREWAQGDAVDNLWQGAWNQLERAQTTREQQQLRQDIQDFMANDPTLRNLRQLYRDGQLSYDNFRRMTESTWRNSDLWARAQQMAQQRQEARGQTYDQENQAELISEDGLLAGPEVTRINPDQIMEDGRPAWRSRATRIQADNARQTAQTETREDIQDTQETDAQDTAPQTEQTEQAETEETKESPETVETVPETDNTGADQQATEADRIRAEMDQLEQDNPVLQILRQSLDNGDTTQEEYEDARQRLLQTDPEYQRLQQQLEDIQDNTQSASQGETRQQNNADTDTRFRRRSVSESAVQSYDEIDTLKKTNQRLKRQAKAQEKLIQELERQTRRSNPKMPDEKAIRKFIENKIEELGSRADADDVINRVLEGYRIMSESATPGEALNNEEAQKLFRSAAGEIVRNAWVDANEEMYGPGGVKDLKTYFKTTPIQVSHDLDGEIISAFGSLDAFNRATFGKMRITRNNVHAMHPDEALPIVERQIGRGLTDSDNEASALISIVEFVQTLYQGDWQPRYAEAEENTIEYLGKDLAAEYFLLEKEQPTELDKAIEKTLKQVAEEQAAESARMQRDLLHMRRMEQRHIQQVEKRHAEREANREKRMTKREYREKIYRHAMRLGQKLTQPSDKNHVPEGFQGAVAGFLESLDWESSFGYLDPEKTQRAPNQTVTTTVTNEDGTTTTRTGKPEDLYTTKRTEKARELMAEIHRINEGKSEGSSNSERGITLDPNLLDNLDTIAKYGGKRVNELDLDELRTVWQTVVALEKAISDANKVLGDSRYATISDIGYRIIEESRKDARREGGRQDKLNYANKALNVVDNLLQVDQLTPETYFHRLGAAGDDLYRQMRRAQDKQVQILDEGVEYYKQAMKDAGITEKDIREWETDAHTYTFDTVFGKKEITLSTGQMLELYLLTKRQQALEHIYKGGITTKSGEVTVKKGKIPVKVKNTQTEAIEVGYDGVQKIVKELTQEQKDFADRLQKYLSGALATHGNEASLEVYGYSKFTEDNYWPIRTKSETNNTRMDKGRDVSDYANTIPNYGMAKAITPKASNAVELNNVTDTFARHLNQMATYSAWLSTNENLVKVLNYTQSTNDAEGKHLEGTTKDALTKIFGEKGQKYYTNLIYDISAGTKAGGEDVAPTDMLLNAFKASAVGANIRVILQQPTSIIRAAEIINPKYLTKISNPFQSFERAKEHSSIARWKDWGYFEMDTGRNLRELMLGEDTKLAKVKNGMMAGAGVADNFAWGIMWAGVEQETRDLHPDMKEGSEEFWQRCNERFSEIIDRTQVVDSVLHRSDIMRSRNPIHRLATSFMSEPTKIYNMVLRDAYDIGTALRTGDAEAVRRSRQHVGRTAAALIASFAVNAFARAIPDFFRNKDRDKDLKTFFNEMWENFIGDFAAWDYIPYLKDFVSIAQGFTVERTDLQGIGDLIQSARKLAEAASGKGKDSTFGAGMAMARKACSAIGLPVDNLLRDVTSISNSIIWATGQHELAYNLDKLMLPIDRESNNGTYYDTLYRAMMDDPTQYQNIYLDMLKNGFDADGIQSAMDLRLWKEAQEKWKDEEDVTSKGSGMLPVEWEEPGKDKEWDAFLAEARKQDNWADLLADDLWTVVAGISDMKSSTKEEKNARRRMVADQPYAEDIKEDAMETILTKSQYKKYMAAREAGISTAAYVDLLEDLEAEAAKQQAEKKAEQEKENAKKRARGEEVEEEDEDKKETTPSITQAVVEAVLKPMQSLTKEQKKAIWGSYFESKSPWG